MRSSSTVSRLRKVVETMMLEGRAEYLIRRETSAKLLETGATKSGDLGSCRLQGFEYFEVKPLLVSKTSHFNGV